MILITNTYNPTNMIVKRISFSIVCLALAGVTMAGYQWWHGKKEMAPHRELQAMDELKKVMSAYQRLTKDSANISGMIRIYDKENKDALKETQRFRFFKSGKNTYAQLSYLQTFSDSIWVLQLDTVNHRVLLCRNKGDLTQIVAPGSIEALFSDTARFTSTASVTEEGRLRRIAMRSELKPEIHSMALFYDTIAYRIRAAEIEWWKPGAVPGPTENKIWLSKMDYDYTPAPRIDVPSQMAAIISFENGQAVLSEGYRGYRFDVNYN